MRPASEARMGAAGRGGGREKRREARSSLPVGELMALDIAAPGLRRLRISYQRQSSTLSPETPQRAKPGKVM